MRRAHISYPISLTRLLTLVTSTVLVLSGTAAGQAKRYPLESASGLSPHNVVAQPATLQGRKGLRVSLSEEAQRRLQVIIPDEQARFPQLASIDGLEFANGMIEAEIAGAPAPGASEGARGFVGIAFRLQDDVKTHDAFYLRPTNGRADDQERRNHAVQYISHPDWPWFRLRKESPSKYESYVDLMPGVWTKVKFEVRGERARLYVHGQGQPTLIVNDLKSGAQGKGGVGLWIDRGTVAHFRDLTVKTFIEGRFEMNLRTVACTAVLLTAANGSSSFQVATPLAPLVDHHQHLLSPALAAALGTELPAAIELPPDLQRRFRENLPRFNARRTCSC
jgi:hypothetical protein